MRCRSCDGVMGGHPGWIVLEDGTKIEEDMCSACRGVVRNIDTLDTKEFMLGSLTSDVASVIFTHGITPVPKIPY